MLRKFDMEAYLHHLVSGNMACYGSWIAFRQVKFVSPCHLKFPKTK